MSTKTTTPAKTDALPSAATIENVLVRGDLADLTEQQRTEYFLRVCQSLGLNPMTRPFQYLTLSGRLTLYATRDATDQLRKINGISVEIVGWKVELGLLIVHARAHDKNGRTDEDYGVVDFKGGGNDAAANAVMKGVTKAKRRVTLSISGLGFLDESEIPGERAPTKVISKAQREQLIEAAGKVDTDMPAFLDYLSERWDLAIGKVGDIPESHYDDAMAQIKRKADAYAKAEQLKNAGHDPATGEVIEAATGAVVGDDQLATGG
jgi:hypothetical protein